MNTLYLMRHAESVANKRGIIQGTSDYPLSEDGILSLNNLKYEDLKKIKKIYASELLRAKQTAEVIKRNLNYHENIRIDNCLNEINWGILNDKEKEFCKINFPDYYRIYSQRGDFNLIPGADNWNYTQARAIAFLEKYINFDNETDLIVSHAAFLRILINLIMGRFRNTPIDLKNCCLYQFVNPLENLEIKNFDIAKSSIVKQVDCFDDTYIMKKKLSLITDNDRLEEYILNYLNNYFDTPYIIFMCNRDSYHLKITKFLSGVHKFGELSYEDTKTLTQKVKLLHDVLKKCNTLIKIEKKDILSELKLSLNYLLEDTSKDIVKNLLSDSNFTNYIQTSNYVLVHNDLHRSNILFDKSNVHLLDFESVKLYPELLQIATYICSAFLLENQIDSIDAILNTWDDKLDVDLINKLINYRLIYGLAFFDKKIKHNDYDDSDVEIKKKYIKALGGRL